MKRIISLLIACVLLISTVPAISASELQGEASGSCGENATWVLEDGVLTISGTGEITVKHLEEPWRKDKDSIEKIIVNEGITKLGDYCFYDLNGLQEIVLPDSLKTIGKQVFQDCGQLLEVTLPKNVESIGESSTGRRAAACFSGDIIQAVNVDPENQRYYSEDGVLFDRYSNEVLCYPIGKAGDSYTVPEGILKIGYGAFWLAKFNSINLPEGLLSIGDSSFFGANILHIEIPDTVTAVGEKAFENCDFLEKITIPESVITIEEYAFASCEMLKEIVILNSQCSITNNNNVIDGDTAIVGFLNSTAQAYAERYGRQFIDINTGKEYNYNHSRNAGYVAMLPKNTGGTAPCFNNISSQDASGEIVGYQPTIALERDPSNPTYQEMLAFVNELTQNSPSDYMKAKAISNWVFDNMTYVYGHFGEGDTAAGVYHIWKNRVGNCEGYTQLTNFLLYLVDIPTATIMSHGHTWSAALAEGKWIMIDSSSGMFDVPPDAFDNIVKISFAVNDNLVCVIDDLSGIKLASYGISIYDHDLVTEITIPSYITHIYSSVFYLEDAYGTVTTHLTIKGTADSYAEAYMKEKMPHYNSYSYEGNLFIAKVGKVPTEDDAIYLLRHVLFPDLYPYENAPDYTKDGAITEADAVYLLRHVLFPELYPI